VDDLDAGVVVGRQTGHRVRRTVVDREDGEVNVVGAANCAEVPAKQRKRFPVVEDGRDDENVPQSSTGQRRTGGADGALRLVVPSFVPRYGRIIGSKVWISY